MRLRPDLGQLVVTGPPATGCPATGCTATGCTANRALHLAIIVRLRYHPGARAYTARRTTEGLSMPEIIRCQKRYLAREVFTALRAGPPPAATAAPKTK